MSKFYYDVCIEYDEEKKEGNPSSSKVEKSWYLDQPLLEQPGDYNLCVSKFSINTEALPVFIPEYNQPQGILAITNGNLKTNYQMMLIVRYKENNKDKNYPFLSNIELKSKTRKNIKKLKTDNIGQYYIDNTDRNGFCYSYSELINAINMILQEGINNMKKNIKNGNGEKILEDKDLSEIYFSLENDKLNLNIPEIFYGGVFDNVTLEKIQLCFSKNMYRLIGNGFPCEEYNDRYFYYLTERDNLLRNDNELYIEQDFSTLVNWNPLKAIIIGTDTLPVVDEYIPIAHYDGHLTHYKTEEYLKYLKGMGKEFNDSTQDVFKRNSMKILDVYYPLTTAPGDIRSTCILSREDIDQGQTIELLPGSPVKRFNIWVKWLDIYGNLHDLYQYPGCCCDIRLCFTKKPVVKEDIAAATDNIVSSLAPPDPKKNKKEPFLKQQMAAMSRSNGKPDGIDLPGADNYGWVHL